MSRPINAEHATDMRIGVTAVEHELLDAVNTGRADRSNLKTLLLHAKIWNDLVRLYDQPTELDRRVRRAAALSAAARLLLAIEAMDAGQ